MAQASRSARAEERGAARPPLLILLVECRAGSLDWLAEKLEGRADVQICGRVVGRVEAVSAVTSKSPGVVLIDSGNDPAAAIAIARRLRALHASVCMILVEGVRGSIDPRDVVAAGAGGVVSTQLAKRPEQLVGAIQVVAGGGYVSAGARAGEIARRLRRTRPAGTHGLTDRETQVLRLVADGLTNREIAEQLSIAEQSAKNHVSNLLRKMNVPNRTAAAAMARRDGLVP